MSVFTKRCIHVRKEREKMDVLTEKKCTKKCDARARLKTARDLELDDIDCLWIEVLFLKSKGFLSGFIYRPPDSSKHLS